MGINEIAILIFFISPFIYCMSVNTVRCERHQNRAERRAKKK